MITGKELWESPKYRIHPQDIGQACFDGTLQAYDADRTPVVEVSNLERIPIYPPLGVNPNDHKILPRLPPIWNWKKELCKCPQKGKACDSCTSPYGEGHIVEKNVNVDAIDLVYELIEKNGGNRNLFTNQKKYRLAINLMQTEYKAISSTGKGEICAVTFRFDDYKKLKNRLHLKWSGAKATRKHISDSYYEQIYNFLFKVEDVDKLIDSKGQTPSPPSSAKRQGLKTDTRLTVTVNTKAWRGKAPEVVFDYLAEQGYDEAVKLSFILGSELKKLTNIYIQGYSQLLKG